MKEKSSVTKEDGDLLLVRVRRRRDDIERTNKEKTFNGTKNPSKKRSLPLIPPCHNKKQHWGSEFDFTQSRNVKIYFQTDCVFTPLAYDFLLDPYLRLRGLKTGVGETEIGCNYYHRGRTPSTLLIHSMGYDSRLVLRTTK